MADFTRPEYASYVALCRELRLGHRIGLGEWFAYPDAVAISDRLQNASLNENVWLPSLSDWLEMIQRDAELMGSSVAFDYDRHDGWCCGTFSRYDAGLITHAYAPTREEAAARLWMAVRSSVPV